jgi:hypothetical protein
LTDQLRQADQDPSLNAFLINSLVALRAVEAAPVIEAAFAANAVDLSIQGDWEEVQIKLGLLTQRLTPRPRSWLPAFLTGPLDTPVAKPDSTLVTRRAKQDDEHAKRRRTRKLAKQSKQKQMRQKKKKR